MSLYIIKSRERHLYHEKVHHVELRFYISGHCFHLHTHLADAYRDALDTSLFSTNLLETSVK